MEEVADVTRVPYRYGPVEPEFGPDLLPDLGGGRGRRPQQDRYRVAGDELERGEGQRRGPEHHRRPREQAFGGPLY